MYKATNCQYDIRVIERLRVYFFCQKFDNEVLKIMSGNNNGYRSSYYPYWGNNNGGYNNSFNQNYFTQGNTLGATPYMPNQPMQPQGVQPIQNNAQMAQMSPYQGVPIKTNKLFVTGVEEAINRSTEFNSETIYFHQDLPIMYEVAVDMKGRKEVYTYDVKAQSNPQQNKETNENAQQKQLDLTGYVTVDEFNDLKENYLSLNKRFERLLEQLRGNSQQRQKSGANQQNNAENREDR